eukprot:COSAG05_NODE_379_length_10567_cov_18.553687_20_plen_50_part_00
MDAEVVLMPAHVFLDLVDHGTIARLGHISTHSRQMRFKKLQVRQTDHTL